MKVHYDLSNISFSYQGFNYPVKNLQETLLTLFQRYSELLISQYSENFEKIVQEDECMPMTVNDQEDLGEVMQYTRYQPDHDILQQYG
jgi:exocyst complex component 6